MQIKQETGTLFIALEGHVDSTNAPLVEQEIIRHPGYAGAEKIVIDAEKLEYISSAGLRLILKLRKHTADLTVINVSSAVYEIFDMTGFVEMVKVEKAYRVLSVDGCTVLGQGSNGVVYRYDPETVVKVYRNANALDDIRRERELARHAFILGIPTAIPYDVVRVGQTYGSVFELLKSTSFSKLINNQPENADHYIEEFVTLLKKIHTTKVNVEDFPSMKAVAVDWAQFLQEHLPQDQGEKLLRLIQEVPETYTMIHGDYHTNNVVHQGEDILLLDMDTLSYGHPIFELGSMYLGLQGFGVLDPTVIEKFLHLPFDTATLIWRKTLPMYLGTQDPEAIRAVEDKAKIIGFARMMRRTIRRFPKDDPAAQQLIAYCKAQLADLLSRIDTLSF